MKKSNKKQTQGFMWNNKLATLVASISLVLLSSCGTSRQEVINEAAQRASSANSDPSMQHIEAIMGDYGTWGDLKVPFSVNVTSPKSLSASGVMTMTRNRMIQISIRMLGFEVAQIVVDNDSVYALEKVHKRYVAEPVEKFLKDFPATVGDLQSLLLGQVFLPGRSESDTENPSEAYNLVSANDPSLPGVCILTPNIEENPADCHFFINLRSTPQLLGFTAGAGENDFNCYYNDVLNVIDVGRVASKLSIVAAVSGTPVSASLEYNMSKAKWNTGATIDWRQPRGYNRIPASALLNLF